VILVDPQTASFLQGSRVDIEGSPGPERLRIRHVPSLSSDNPGAAVEFKSKGAEGKAAIEHRMRTDELNELLELFARADHWCQGAEARTAGGVPVKYSDPDAVAWDLTGALCFLFGWDRACTLFCQVDKHLLKDRALRWRVHDVHIESMLALQEKNDSLGTTHDWLVTQLKSMRVFEPLPQHSASSSARDRTPVTPLAYTTSHLNKEN
jgi:hypothetical protein